MSKRKSFLNCRRRRSRSLGAILPSTFCERIPMSLPKKERLEKIISYALEYSLSTVAREFGNMGNIDIEKLKKNGKPCFVTIEEKIKEKNLYALATAETLLKEQLYATLLESNSCNDEIKRLEEEGNKWNEILSQYKEDFKNVETNSTANEVNFDEDEKCLDYSSILSETSSMHEDLQNKVMNLKKGVERTTKCVKFSEEFVKDFNYGINECFLENDKTPRTLFKKIGSSNQNDLSFNE